MAGQGTPFLIGALICFVVYFGNVILGSVGAGAPLGDVAEMLVLFVSSMLFVAGILGREAAKERADALNSLMNE